MYSTECIPPSSLHCTSSWSAACGQYDTASRTQVYKSQVTISLHWKVVSVILSNFVVVGCFWSVHLFVRRTLWVPVHYDDNWQVQSRQKPKLLKLWFLHIHILSLLMANNSAADSKGDERSEWEMPFSRCSSSETPEPIFKKLHSWLSRLPHLTYKHLDQSPQRRVCANVKLSPSGVYFLFFFVSCSPQKVRPLYR